jgi:hypothetical protein
MYWTIEIPYQAQFAAHPFMPRNSSGPFSVLTRGAFRTNAEAVAWARETLPQGAKVRFREIKP